MPLIAIHDPEATIAQAEDGPQGLPLLHLPGTSAARWLLKLKPHGCCEVLGYQLAPRVGVPVMPAIPVWCPGVFGKGGQRTGEGRIGLAIQYAETLEDLTREQATARAPETVAATLLLCMLDRHEWGQFAATEFGMVFYDLERLFASFCPERMGGESWDDVARQVGDADVAYRSAMRSCSQEVLDEAAKLGLTESLRLVAANAATISMEELLDIFDLEPHPLAKLIARIAAETTVMRFGHAAQLLCG